MEHSSVSNTTTLYSLHQIFVASFIGTPIASAWLASKNYSGLGRNAEARRILLLGAAATVALAFVSVALPLPSPNVALPLLYSAGIYFYAQHLLGPTIEEHLDSGGNRGSWWMVIGTSLCWLVVFVASVALVMLLFPSIVSTGGDA